MPENVKRTNLEKSIANGLREYYLNEGLTIEVSANDVFVEQALDQDGSLLVTVVLKTAEMDNFMLMVEYRKDMKIMKRESLVLL